MSYQTRSAVLLLVYNRPDATKQVFETIRATAPGRLYIAADGSVTGDNDQAQLCARVRNIVNEVNWPCEVKTQYSDVNLGCKEAVSLAIDWFFEQEEEGIILEDDCIPSPDFFRFCDAMLSRYRNDTRVRTICGSNLQHGKKWGNSSYYFSNLTHVWGWAGWRRVWQSYNKDLAGYNEHEVSVELKNIFDDPIIVAAWVDIFKAVKSGVIDTWDYQLTFINFFNNGLSVIPNVNLVTNIGFGPNATHSKNAQSKYAALPHQLLGDITHPTYILPQKQADYYTLSYDFEVERIRRKHAKWHRRLKRWFIKTCK